MLKLIKSLFGGSGEPKQAAREAAVEYEGYSIEVAPQQESGGWSTEAYISKVIDGETQTHHFIRADKTNSREGAVETTMNKCRIAIDQLGDSLFRS